MSPFSPTHKRPITSIRGGRDIYIYIYMEAREEGPRTRRHKRFLRPLVLPAFRPRIYRSRGIGKIKFGQHF